ncbi:MAG TPA: hypothetical protein VFC78_13950 [Tepidisphaeraceae bacterium]|nr:hypothetical protein [Tepidisphaeraceae bacterium]
MRRRLFTSLCALSLLLCVATTVIWLGSYRYTSISFYDEYVKAAPQRGVTVLFGNGRFYLEYRVDLADVSRPGWQSYLTGRKEPAFLNGVIFQNPTLANRLGFDSHRIRNQSGTREWVVIPLWLAAIMMGALPILWVRRRAARAKSLRAGHRQCRRCGYDLRATPDRCPECGTIVPPSTQLTTVEKP